jgi:hypothetical protein
MPIRTSINGVFGSPPESVIMDKIAEINNKINLQLTEHSTEFPDILYKDFRELENMLFDYKKLKDFVNHVHYCRYLNVMPENDAT